MRKNYYISLIEKCLQDADLTETGETTNHRIQDVMNEIWYSLPDGPEIQSGENRLIFRELCGLCNMEGYENDE